MLASVAGPTPHVEQRREVQTIETATSCGSSAALTMPINQGFQLDGSLETSPAC